MPFTAKFRLRQPDSLDVCRCSGPFPNNEVVVVITDPRYPPGVTVVVPPGTVSGPTPEGADAGARTLGTAQGHAIMDGILDDLDAKAADAALVCRNKSGTATLIGFPEFCSPSDPPKLYRRSTYSGNNPIQAFMFPDCSGDPTATSNVRQSGRDLYDRDTGAFSTTAVFADGAAPQTPSSDPCAPGSSCESVVAIDATNFSITGLSACCFVASVWRKAQGTRSQVLSEEDTEDDANARAASEIADWTGCAGLGCMDLTCTAFRSDRTGTADIFFGWRNVETQASWLAGPRCTYQVTVHFARRLLGSGGPFLDLGMIFEATVVAPDNPELADQGGVVRTEWIPVPNEAGWETRANSCHVVLIPFIP